MMCPAALGGGAYGNLIHSEAGVEKGDFDILIAAQIAEALAVTTYFNIIELAPFFNGLPPVHALEVMIAFTVLSRNVSPVEISGPG